MIEKMNTKTVRMGAIICLGAAMVAFTIGLAYVWLGHSAASRPKLKAEDYLKTGSVYYEDGMYQRALASFQDALELEPKNAEILR